MGAAERPASVPAQHPVPGRIGARGASWPEQPRGRALGSAPTGTRRSRLCRRRSRGWGTRMTEPSTLSSGGSRINRSDQQSHCGLLKTKQSQLLFEACRGAVANLVTRGAARHRGNLTVPIKHSAAAQSNRSEAAGTRWGPGRDAPRSAPPPRAACPRREPLLAGGASTGSPSSPPSRLFPRQHLLAPGQHAALQRLRQFAGGCGAGPPSGQRHPAAPRQGGHPGRGGSPPP